MNSLDGNLRRNLNANGIRLATILALALIGQVFVSLLFDLPFSPKLGGDSGRYISGGESFPHLDSVQWGYFGYCFIFWIATNLFATQWLVIGIQMFASLWAAWALWCIAEKYAGSRAGFFASAFYLLNPLIAQWNRYLLTDSLFYVGVITVLYGLVVDRASHRSQIPIALGLLIVVSMRPNGIILLPVVLVFLTFRFTQTRRSKTALTVSIITVSAIAFTLLPNLQSGGGGEQNSFVQRAARGEVFWNSTDQSLTMPQVAADETSNSDFLRYVISNPIEMARLGITRAAWETIQIRPWYSSSLNFYAAISTGMLVVGSAFGVRRIRRAGGLAPVLVLTIPSISLVAATWAIHEGRFGWWYLVVWIPVMAVGLELVVKRLAARLT
jgi:4-amino-4-deoxy-L-arabinose transferase-like glycosyltransferase